MIQIEKLQELIALMVENDLIELDVRDGDESVSLSRPNRYTHAAIPAAPAPPPSPSGPPAGSAADGAPAPAATAAETGLLTVQSPMVGTFYSSPKPDAPAFIKVGDHVTPDTVVCLIEAMKVFSEVKAEVSGTVRKIVAKNSDSVEFGQTLLLVEPD